MSRSKRKWKWCSQTNQTKQTQQEPRTGAEGLGNQDEVEPRGVNRKSKGEAGRSRMK